MVTTLVLPLLGSQRLAHYSPNPFVVLTIISIIISVLSSSYPLVSFVDDQRFVHNKSTIAPFHLISPYACLCRVILRVKGDPKTILPISKTSWTREQILS